MMCQPTFQKGPAGLFGGEVDWVFGREDALSCPVGHPGPKRA